VRGEALRPRGESACRQGEEEERRAGPGYHRCALSWKKSTIGLM